MGRLIGEGAGGLLDAAGAGRGGVIAALDPRVRIVAAAAFAIAVASCTQFGALALALATAFVALLLARLPLGRTLRRLAALDAFIVVMIALLPFTVPGEPLFHAFGWPASREGFLKAATIALKASAIMLMAIALVGSLEAVAFAGALRRLGAPERLVHLILFTVRYLDVLDREYRRLRTAMKARGFRPSNSRHTYVSLGYLVGMMLVRALERSERILQAMKCRGFSGRLFLADDGRLGAADFAFAIAFAAALAALACVEVARVISV